ncbi:hypothetical protein XF30_21055 [Bradyrhizobium sp. SUTN9-2]|uniref:radical SAM protein n=1 Tax=Bradyrhizobium sp. SUTN9-2 TaxID=1167456 RepID=UPI000D648449|nr:radical SAM protein [Bradyrhizobium sp. SUTN9-2]PWE78860.1 hypothetical protein XF30_21055 [Bradyrhizobium sp. SUTN9-2]
MTQDLQFRDDIPTQFNEHTILSRRADRVRKVLTGEVVAPFEVIIHPSSSCNLACQWCIGDHVPAADGDGKPNSASKHTDKRLSNALHNPSAMRKVVESIASYSTTQRDGSEYRIENVSFSGLIGEPLLAKEAVKVAVEFLASRGLRVGLFTNGILLDASLMRTLLRAAYVNVSIDAASAQTYARLKGRNPNNNDLFLRAITNVETLSEQIKKSGSPLELNASFVMYPENYHEVFDAAKLSKQLGIKHFRLKRDISGERQLSHDQNRRAAELVAQIQSDLSDQSFKVVPIHRPDVRYEASRSFDYCRIIDHMAAIGSDGEMYPCNYHPRPGGLSFGNVIQSGFASVWEGKTRQDVRSQTPRICPAVCDPFKMRANALLDKVAARPSLLDQLGSPDEVRL